MAVYPVGCEKHENSRPRMVILSRGFFELDDLQIIRDCDDAESLGRRKAPPSFSLQRMCSITPPVRVAKG